MYKVTAQQNGRISFLTAKNDINGNT